MDQIPIQTPHGPGTLFRNKGVARHILFPDCSVGDVPLVRMVMDLSRCAQEETDTFKAAMAQAVLTFDTLPSYHAQIMQNYADRGFVDIAFQSVTARFSAAPPDARPNAPTDVALTLTYQSTIGAAMFGIADDGALLDLSTGQALTYQGALPAAQTVQWEPDPVTHSLFGTVRPTTLATIAQQSIDERQVDIDLFLPTAGVSKLTAANLDPFVSMIERLDTLSVAVRQKALDLKQDWFADWSDPANAERFGILCATYPTAADGDLPDNAFLRGLWVSRICLCPFGSGSNDATPCAIWDVHALPHGKDDQIFAITTAPDGAVRTAALES